MTSLEGNASSLIDSDGDEDNNPLWFCRNETTSSTWELSKTIVYWVEGFSLTTTSIVGIIGNMITCLVLKKLGRLNSNVFNQVGSGFVVKLFLVTKDKNKSSNLVS